MATSNNINMVINDVPNELSTYLSNVYNVAKNIISKLEIDSDQISQLISSGPLEEYKYLHLADYQKERFDNEYSPILISKDFSKIYTNTGILTIKCFLTGEVTDKPIQQLIDSLNLKIYNNQYYYVDKEYSYEYLKCNYSVNTIEKEWTKIIL